MSIKVFHYTAYVNPYSLLFLKGFSLYFFKCFPPIFNRKLVLEKEINLRLVKIEIIVFETITQETFRNKLFLDTVVCQGTSWPIL